MKPYIIIKTPHVNINEKIIFYPHRMHDIPDNTLKLFYSVCRDAVESVTGLYNQVEEKLHTLVMRSNESLQHLEFLFRLREMEAKISTVATTSPLLVLQHRHAQTCLKFTQVM